MGWFTDDNYGKTTQQAARDYFNRAYASVRGGGHFEYNMFHAHYVEMDMLDKLHKQISDLQTEIKSLRKEITELKER